MEGDAAPPGSEGGLCRRGPAVPAVPAVARGRGRCARRRRRLSEKTAHGEARRRHAPQRTQPSEPPVPRLARANAGTQTAPQGVAPHSRRRPTSAFPRGAGETLLGPHAQRTGRAVSPCCQEGAKAPTATPVYAAEPDDRLLCARHWASGAREETSKHGQKHERPSSCPLTCRPWGPPEPGVRVPGTRGAWGGPAAGVAAGSRGTRGP